MLGGHTWALPCAIIDLGIQPLSLRPSVTAYKLLRVLLVDVLTVVVIIYQMAWLDDAYFVLYSHIYLYTNRNVYNGSHKTCPSICSPNDCYLCCVLMTFYGKLHSIFPSFMTLDNFSYFPARRWLPCEARHCHCWSKSWSPPLPLTTTTTTCNYCIASPFTCPSDRITQESGPSQNTLVFIFILGVIICGRIRAQLATQAIIPQDSSPARTLWGSQLVLWSSSTGKSVVLPVDPK